MNKIVTFRLCKLTDEELLKKVDVLTDEMFESQTVPTRYIPARPDADYDLLVGELLKRYQEQKHQADQLAKALRSCQRAIYGRCELSPDELLAMHNQSQTALTNYEQGKGNDGCDYCAYNKPGVNAGLFCINNCINGSMFKPLTTTYSRTKQ